MKLTKVIPTLFAALSILVLQTSCDETPTKTDKPVEKKGSASAEVVKTKITEVSSAEAKKRLADGSGVVVIDVRTPGEFAAGHIEGAKNIDFRGSDFAKNIEPLDRNVTYLVHCAVGGRSGQSKPAFQNLGFKNILHLSNGFNEWKAEGNKVVK